MRPDGIYAPIPGGDRHQWQFPLTLPPRWRAGSRRRPAGSHHVEADLAGTGYTDHCWGAGLTGDVLESWTFGRADLGPTGAAIAIWFVPRVGPHAGAGTHAGHRRVLRLHPDGSVVCHEAVELVERDPWHGALGMPSTVT